MLQFFRSLAKSFFAKVLFGVLLLSFGVWGIGDLFRQNPQSTKIITVGSKTIGVEQVRAAVDQDLQHLKSQGITLDRDQAKQFGLIDSSVQGLISRSLLDQEAERLKLSVGEDQVAQAISNDPTFHDKDGKLDRNRFKALLAANRMSERDYVTILRNDIPREALANVAQNTVAPQTLVKIMFNQRQERRVADFVFLPSSGISALDQPTPAEIKDYYEKHKASFTAPEHRNFTTLVVTSADAVSSVPISEDKLQQAYQFRMNDFKHGELRNVKQMLLPDEVTAQKARAALDRGQTFEEVASTIAHQSQDTVNLGFVERQSLPADLAEPVFSAKAGQVSPPIKTSLGWTVLKVEEIKPPAVTSFNDARPQLEAELRREESGDSLYQLSNKIEDALAAGADLASIAQQFSLKPIVVKDVDASGHHTGGDADTTLTVDAPAILKTAFETPQGQSSNLISTNDDKFYVVHVDAVLASSLKPFDQIAGQVMTAWQQDQREKLVAIQAKNLAAQVKPGTSLATAAAQIKLSVTTSEPLLRSDTESALPTPLIQQLFVMSPDQVTIAAGRNGNQQGQYVAVLKEIRAADPRTDASMHDALAKQLNDEIGTELVMELNDVLRERYPVQINNAALEQLF